MHDCKSACDDCKCQKIEADGSVGDLGVSPKPALGLVKVGDKKKKKTLAREVLDQGGNHA
jgi:hypothetical protein